MLDETKGGVDVRYTIHKGDDSHYMEDDAGIVAEMTFSVAGDAALIVDSTYVRDDSQGQGLGMALLDSVVAQARAEHRRVVPLCPFVKAQFDKHPEKYADVAVG